jgi:hypothetical protein
MRYVSALGNALALDIVGSCDPWDGDIPDSAEGGEPLQLLQTCPFLGRLIPGHSKATGKAAACNPDWR